MTHATGCVKEGWNSGNGRLTRLVSWLTSWVGRDKISAISTEEHETDSGDDLDLYGDSDNRKLRSAELMPRIANVEAALVCVRVTLGIFFLFEGWDKLPWVSDSAPLTSILNRWSETASPHSRWYIQTVALPGAPVFARLVFFGEVFAGLALIFGFWARIAAAITFLLVLNIHLAHSTLFQLSFFSRGDGLPVIGGLLALAIGGNRLPLSLTKGN